MQISESKSGEPVSKLVMEMLRNEGGYAWLFMKVLSKLINPLYTNLYNICLVWF